MTGVILKASDELKAAGMFSEHPARPSKGGRWRRPGKLSVIQFVCGA